MSILFICKKRIDYGCNQSGVAYGLGNSAQFIVNYLNKQHIEAKLVFADDANSIDRLVTEFNPEYVIIEAIWVTAKKFQELLAIPRHQNRVWIVRLHSRLSFLANEGIAIKWLMEYKETVMQDYDFWISPNTYELACDLHDLGMRCVYLPNIYSPMEGFDNPNKKFNRILDVGCFGAVRPMKNNLAQAMAAIKFADDLNMHMRFHINSSRTEQNGDAVLKNIRALFSDSSHELVEHSWQKHHDFLNLVRQMDIGMQVSFSETFNIVASDFVHCNVPIVVSQQIDWMPFWTKVKDPNSTEEIRDKLHFVMATSWLGLHRLNKQWLDYSNSNAGREWLQFLNTSNV
jgi:hypothetical protein